MMNARNPQDQPLFVEPVDECSFRPFGSLVVPSADGEAFGPADARLHLGDGVPRFYVMHLEHRPLRFDRITRHRRVTQCLASADGSPWIIAVAPPGDPDDADAIPDPDSIRAFEIPGGVVLALDRGTWHAGPYFQRDHLDFFNLELSDTNVVDHHSVDLPALCGHGFALRATGSEP